MSVALVNNSQINKSSFPLYFRGIFLLAAAVPYIKVTNRDMQYPFWKGGISGICSLSVIKPVYKEIRSGTPLSPALL